MDLTLIVFQLLAGLIIGFIIGMTGIGGGVLVMPTLTLLFGLSPSLAVGTASLYSLLTKIYAVYEHRKIRNIDFPISNYFLIGAIPANLGFSLLITRYIRMHAQNLERIQTLQQFLALFIGIVLSIAAVLLLIQLIPRKNSPKAHTGESGEPALPENNRSFLPKGIAYGALVGALIASTSVGGGVIIVPILLSVFKLSTGKTVGTSLYIAVLLVFVSSLVYGASGQLVWQTAVVMALGSIGGVYAGARSTKFVPERLLKFILALLILSAAVSMIAPIVTDNPGQSETSDRLTTTNWLDAG